MASNFAITKAAQAWEKDTTKHKYIDEALYQAFADIIDEVCSKPWLGNATTEELLNELKARAEIGGYAEYRTVDDEIKHYRIVATL